MADQLVSEYIVYRSGYKYQLEETYSIKTDIKPLAVVNTNFIRLDYAGLLTIKEGYAWDGPSGPTEDTPSFMRGSLVHDALYQLMREGLLDRDDYRKPADELLKKICLEDGMNPFRAEYVYRAVRIFGKSYNTKSDPNPIIYAPKKPNFIN